MKKEQLKNIYYLSRERQVLADRLLKYKSMSEYSSSPRGGYEKNISDRTGKGAIKKTHLEVQIERNKKSCEIEEARLEKFIATVEDSRTRLALRFRFIKLLEWADVAANISPYETADSARKLVERFLETMK